MKPGKPSTRVPGPCAREAGGISHVVAHLQGSCLPARHIRHVSPWADTSDERRAPVEPPEYCRANCLQQRARDPNHKPPASGAFCATLRCDKHRKPRSTTANHSALSESADEGRDLCFHIRGLAVHMARRSHQYVQL